MCYSNNLLHPFSWKLKYFSVAVLLLMSSLVWGDGEQAAVGDMAKPEIVAASTADFGKAEPEKKMFNEEARDMPGIVFGSIIVNGVLVVVFFWLLWREWKKHERKPKSGTDSKSEEP